MVKSARVKRAQLDRAAGPVLPEDLILWEIFYRLPAKELLRCRAVCRSWRRLTCGAEFLLAHHRRQPSLPLVLFNRETLPKDKVPATVDAFDLRQSPAVRRPVLGFSSYNECEKYYIHASCDGLLLLSRTCRLYYICNPATRQWCPLPDVSNVAALYHHRPSGEYRVLYRKHPDGPGSVVYYVLAVGSSSLEEQRCIGPPVPSPSVENFITQTRLDHDNPPVPLHDCLHWHYRSPSDTESKVVVFDTVDESFRCMGSPTGGNVALAHLSQMDGTLGIRQIDRDTMTVQVWALQDYEREEWSLKHIIPFPVVEMTKYLVDKTICLMAVSENGDMLVFGHYPWLLFHCDSKGNLVDKFQQDFVIPRVLRLSFKESLVRHAFFERKDRKRVKPQSFFRGL